MNKKGFTIMEIIVSVALISIVMLLLFHLLIDMEYNSEHATYAKENQINRATITRLVEKDMLDKGVKSVIKKDTDTNEVDIEITFSDNTTKDLIVSWKYIKYGEEGYEIKELKDETVYDLDNVVVENLPGNSNGNNLANDECSYIMNVDSNGDGQCDINCEGTTPNNTNYSSCPLFSRIHITIPVKITGYPDNFMDDLEIFYIRKLP